MPFLNVEEHEIAKETNQETKPVVEDSFRGIAINSKYRINFDASNMWLEEHKKIDKRDKFGKLLDSKMVWTRTSGFYRSLGHLISQNVEQSVLKHRGDLVGLTTKLNELSEMIETLKKIIIVNGKLKEVGKEPLKKVTSPVAKEKAGLVQKSKVMEIVDEQEETDIPKKKSKFDW
jgi:hypothetical protein